jgi:hypothetical protein
MNNFEQKAAKATVAIGAAGLLLALIQYVAPSGSQPPSAASPVPVEITVKTPAADPGPSKLSQIMVEDTIGRNIEYVEGIIGKPTHITDMSTSKNLQTYRRYIVEGCDVSIETDKKNSIALLRLNISNACTFEWRRINMNLRGLPKPETARISDVFRNDSINLDQTSGCISSCGNAGDPEITFTSHRLDARMNLSLNVGIYVDSIDDFEQSHYISKNISKPNDPVFSKTRLQDICDKNIDRIALKYFGDMNIEFVELTNDLHILEFGNECDIKAVLN